MLPRCDGRECIRVPALRPSWSQWRFSRRCSRWGVGTTTHAARSSLPCEAARALALLTGPDGGVADGVVAHAYGAARESADRRAMEKTFPCALDGGVRSVAGPTAADTAAHAVLGAEPSLIVIDRAHDDDVLGRLRTETARTTVPVVALNGQPVGSPTTGDGTDSMHAEIARRLEQPSIAQVVFHRRRVVFGYVLRMRRVGDRPPLRIV
jgi:hypothetical protein